MSRALNPATPPTAKETVAPTENSLFLEFLKTVIVNTLNFSVE